MPYGTSRPITGKDTAPRSERVTLAQSTTLRLQQRLSCTVSAMTRSPLTRESIMKTYPRLLESTGITIEKIRKERKMTKTALADFSDLQDCYVRGIIKGKRNPTITAIYSICEALGLSPLEFFKRVTDELNGLNKPRKNLQ